MKRLLILLFCFPFFSVAQNKPLMAEGVYPDLYLSHSVAAKENYYSIGRMYNISPKELAPYNHLELDKGLALNQVIKIPLTTDNFLQNNIVSEDEVLVPVYHTVKDKEGLYRVSVNYNKVPLETLRQWNNIKGEAVSNGTKLIIGFLKVKKSLSPLAGMAKKLPAVTNPAPVTVGKPETVKPDITNETLPVVKNPGIASQEKKVNETEIPLPEVAPKKNNPPAVPKVKEPLKPAETIRAAKDFNGGFFKNEFDKQARGNSKINETGTAGIFKSTSGWEDGKYYCLHNAALPGTIVKITSTITGKSVYAKVLDIIPDMSQNNNLLTRLSNAAAAELGVAETKFECSISYSK